MLVKSVLVRPQGLRPRALAPTCPLATPLVNRGLGSQQETREFFLYF